MQRMILSADEVYPVYSLYKPKPESKSVYIADIPDDLLARYEAVERAWARVQEELDEIYVKMIADRRAAKQ